MPLEPLLVQIVILNITVLVMSHFNVCIDQDPLGPIIIQGVQYQL